MMATVVSVKEEILCIMSRSASDFFQCFEYNERIIRGAYRSSDLFMLDLIFSLLAAMF